MPSSWRKGQDDAPEQTDDGKHWYRCVVHAKSGDYFDNLLERKVEARSSGEAAAKIREEFEASLPVMDLPAEYEIVVSRVFQVKNLRVRRDLEMRDRT